MDKHYVIDFKQLGIHDLDKVGGKNASLGEMISHLTQLGVLVPGGFATTADAYREFLAHDGLAARISKELATLNVDDVVKLAETGARIRKWIAALPYPASLEQAIRTSYASLIQQAGKEFSVAVRSSATAEDLPDASFAGQQETILNVRGIDQVLQAVKEVYASLYNDRAIAYRVHHGFEHTEVALSAGIQRMVRSDLGASGVLFTLDTESGFDKVVFITAAYGLGETVVQGTVNPDEFYVYKPSLATGKYPIVRRSLGSKSSMMVYGDGKSGSRTVKTIEVDAEARMRFCLNDADVITLAKQALIIEKHYARPMDIEWAKDGTDGKLYILQARPETVKSRRNQRIDRYILKTRGPVLVEGRSIGQKIGAGTAKIIQRISEMNHIKEGDVLVTDMTDPDWEPIMKRAAAIVTNRGGRTCHAAIIARELGIPAVVGCGDATHKVKDGQTVTVSCAEGDTGHIYAGKLDFEHREIKLDHMPKAPLKIMMNVGNPERAFSFAMLPNKGVGLARLEFIINRMIGVHPKALINFETQPVEIKQQIQERIAGYRDPVSFYVERLAEGIATIAAAFAPEPVIVRTSDFKSNEYANLIGGRQYEPHEENPMLGFRGASRYIAEGFRDCFELECQALRKVRDDMGLDNVQVMIPFVRTIEEARQVTELLSANGLKRGDNGLKVIMMCELPSNAVLAEQFLQYFDGFSIGSNDMTQLTLGLDRDSGVIAHLFDERNDAVKSMLSMAIQACRKHHKYIGICGQGPSDHPDLALWLLDQGIESISLNPDTVVETWIYLAGEAK
ncbi:MAG TPA: phosphoenolpyruvate synthase [Gammaproteobacteria bacterium]|nr:phosphoenolpyruvate synthase [Gammaproteobacteria bacterium]